MVCMEKYDVVIIGSGLGGLQCGFILSKHGMKVCVLEKNAQPGGCMQSFRRGNHTFDTGLHYVGGLDAGQPLHRLFDYFGLMELPWHRLDDSGFDEVILHDKSYLFANGFDRFAETLSEHFPRQQKNLKKYTKFLQQVSADIFSAFTKQNEEDLYSTSLFAQPAYDFLVETIDNPLLRQVLSGTSLKMELNPQTLPLYTFAQINSSFIQSAWRLAGDSSQIADLLIKRIEAFGGNVYMNAEVTRLIEEGGKISAAEVNGNSPIFADYFIANTHPAVALALITESKNIRNIYRKRINNLENTFGFFTVNVVLKDHVIPYQNRNIYVYQTGDVWQYADYKPENVNTCAIISFQAPRGGKSCLAATPHTVQVAPTASCIDILTPMYPQEVAQWSETRTGQRGDDYLAYKKQKAADCIKLTFKHIPGLREMANPTDVIKQIHTSTSLTYRDYTGTLHGSAYGIRKNYDQLMATLLSPRTPEPNLFLTGQNLNLHGVLGVSMTSFFTCAGIIDMKEAMKPFLSSL